MRLGHGAGAGAGIAVHDIKPELYDDADRAQR
jgi:hypothetical protein